MQTNEHIFTQTKYKSWNLPWDIPPNIFTANDEFRTQESGFWIAVEILLLGIYKPGPCFA